VGCQRHDPAGIKALRVAPLTALTKRGELTPDPAPTARPDPDTTADTTGEPERHDKA
jgi:hypothetical protein